MRTSRNQIHGTAQMTTPPSTPGLCTSARAPRPLGLGPSALGIACLSLVFLSCNLSDEPKGLARARPAATTVKMDFFHKPLPELPLPNDIATVYDASSATRRRVNASMIAPTQFESRTRELLNDLDGWGLLQPITIPFTGPLDPYSILAGHQDADYDTSNDVLYLIDIDRASPDFGRLYHLDVGNGNYPPVVEERARYWENDPRAGLMTLIFEEVDEDLNGNGILDPGEDTDADGVLDKPNYLPGVTPDPNDPAARYDALMTFYERETNTLIAKPLVPLRERTTYAVVVTRRILDANGEPVGSPYAAINHTAQTDALAPLREVLPAGLTLDDVAYAFSFTTQSVQTQWTAIRDGLYGHGVQRHLGEEYPPIVDELFPLRDPARFPNATQLHLLYGEEWLAAARLLAPQLLGLDARSEQYRIIEEAFAYIDYFVIGSYQSPQLYERYDEDGNWLPLNDQSWPRDIDRVPAKAVPETIYFTLAVPRKEISARGEGKPAPTVILGHGYTSQRFPVMMFGGYFAKHGMATISIDGPSHGISISEQEESIARALLSARGLLPLVDATFKDRAFDQNNDGRVDSGADFWTSYLFHTRDVVRQFMLDYHQLVRVMRSFDGVNRADFDLDGDGVPDLAGDFDNDGEIDIGGDAKIVMSGGSLGGILSMLVGAVEPEVTAIAPIAGGAGYSDMGTRTLQGGAIEAFVLRVMGPIYAGTVNLATGAVTINTTVVDLNDDARIPIGGAAGIQAGDTMVVENLVNGVSGCGIVDPAGRVRASLESDRGDAIRIVFYRGDQLVPATTCGIRPGAEIVDVIDTFEVEVRYHGETFAVGSPLRSLEDGLGIPRATPDFRRMMGLGQLVLDPADPSSYARHLLDEPLEYPGTGDRTGCHTLVLTSLGDMNVPAGSGVTFGRAAGLIEYLEPNPVFGAPENQVLLDAYVAEAVHNLNRFTDADGRGVHLDVDVLSDGDDIWGPQYPRLDPPLRIGVGKPDALGGVSAALFPLTRDTGQHGFDQPGAMIDDARRRCRQACAEGGSNPCGCNDLQTYDVGQFLFNLASRYLVTDGEELDIDPCHSRDDCDYRLPAPALRDTTQLP